MRYRSSSLGGRVARQHLRPKEPALVFRGSGAMVGSITSSFPGSISARLVLCLLPMTNADKKQGNTYGEREAR